MTALNENVTNAMHRIEELYIETEGKCYVSFSGGKDSTVLLALIKMCEDILTIPQNSIPAVFCNTGIEMGITVNFVNWVKDYYYQNVEIIRPEKSFSWVLNTCGKPLRSKAKSEKLNSWYWGIRSDSLKRSLLEGGRSSSFKKLRLKDDDLHFLHDDFNIRASADCCEYLKKKPFENYSKTHFMLGVLQGVRMYEGGARDIAARSRLSNGGKLCTWVKNGVIQKAPIIDWTAEIVDEFIEKYNVPISEAYTKYGFDRTGCMGCPYAKEIAHNLEYLYQHEPNRYKACMFWLKDVYIAQNVILSFDNNYEEERKVLWRDKYEPMRQEMLRKYRPDSKRIKQTKHTTLF